MSLTRVPVNLITGYPGAGKTTVIRSLLAQRPRGARWAVLVNDFGAAGYDDLAGGEDGVAVSAVSGGCVCCTAQVELRTALVRLLREARPQRVLIELSGAGRPPAILGVLREPGLGGSIELRAGLCVLDPRQFADPALGTRDDYLEQMVCADILVINKNDLADAAQLALLRQAAARLAGRMAVVTAHGEVSATLLDSPPRSA